MHYQLMCAIGELRRRKWRTAANVLGYLLAVGIMVLLAGTALVSRTAANNILRNTGTHFIAFIPTCLATCPADPAAEQGEGFVANGVASSLFATSYVERVAKLPAVKDVSPYLLYRFKHPADGHLFTIGGFDPAGKEAVRTTCCAAADIISGRFIKPGDAGVALLEEAYARSRGLKTGETITVMGMACRVIGIVNPGIRPAKADVYVPIDDAKRLINAVDGLHVGDEANVVLVEVAAASRQQEAIASVKKTIPGAVISTYACYKPAAQVAWMNDASARLLTIIVGAAAIALSLRSQLSSVVERRHDIGILKAIGWTDGRIVVQILLESALQASAGGLLGFALAALALAALPINSFAGSAASGGIPLLRLGGAALLLAFAGGMLAGGIPALVAARMRPAQALRQL